MNERRPWARRETPPAGPIMGDRRTSRVPDLAWRIGFLRRTDRKVGFPPLVGAATNKGAAVAKTTRLSPGGPAKHDLAFLDALSFEIAMPFVLIALAVASRFLPHPPNVACVAAVGLFAGAHLTSWRAWIVPLAAMVGADTLGTFLGLGGQGFYSPIAMAGVYAGMLCSVPLGRWIGASSGPGRIIGGTLIASTIFFVLSNLGVLLAGWYPWTISGAAACFVAALPFFGYSLLGDLVYSCGLFAAARFVIARTRHASTQAVSALG